MSSSSNDLYNNNRKRYIELMLTLWCSLKEEESSSETQCKSSEVPRKRKDFINNIVTPLGAANFRQAYRMHLSSFNRLYEILQPDLEKHFFQKGGGKRNPKK